MGVNEGDESPRVSYEGTTFITKYGHPGLEKYKWKHSESQKMSVTDELYVC